MKQRLNKTIQFKISIGDKLETPFKLPTKKNQNSLPLLQASPHFRLSFLVKYPLLLLLETIVRNRPSIPSLCAVPSTRQPPCSFSGKFPHGGSICLCTSSLQKKNLS